MSQPTSPSPPAHFIREVTQAQRHLYAFIQNMIWHPTDIDDVLQEANLVMWRLAEEFDASRPFLPWAMRIAQLQAMAWLKNNGRAKLRLDDSLLDTIAAEALTETEELEPRRMALSACLERLSSDHRALIAQRYQPNGCVNEVATERGSSAKAVSEMLRRIRGSLLTCIERRMEKA